MNDRSNPVEHKDECVGAALREYLERADRGDPIDREAFLSQHAEIADELRSFLAAEEELKQLAANAPAGERATISTKSIADRGQETIAPQSVMQAETGLRGQFGRYRIVRALGSGAMGTVYLAEDTQLDRPVALKTPHFQDDPTGEQLKRFYREARAAASLRHANICPVFDVGQIEGKHYISMAYIEGRPLSAFIQPDKPQNERQILTVVRKLALALQEAHDHGIVHRDLKPANIMVDQKGEPLIMDFGLARQARRDEDIRLTQTGALLGTPAYMSPEQVEGESDKIGSPTDQYSLAVILYELLTGALPFRGSVIAVMGQILSKEPPHPRDFRPDLDPRVETICLKMMAKTPSERFPSMKAVADEFTTLLKSPAANSTSKEKPASSPVQSPASGRIPAEAGVSQALKSLKVKAVTERDLLSLEELARNCYSRRDFEQVIQIIEQIPEMRRNAAMQALLEKARGIVDEIAFLICDIDEAVRLNDRQRILEKTDELLKIKPGHHRALEVQKSFSGGGAGGAARIGPLQQFAKPWNEGGWIPWSVLAFGLAVFGVMMGVIVIYFGKTAIVIDIQDPDITVEVMAQGNAVTITGPKEEKVTVDPGEQQLKIVYAGLETLSKSFELKKGVKRRVKVWLVDKQLAANLDGEPLGLETRIEKGNQKKRDVAGAPASPVRASGVSGQCPLGLPAFVRGEWSIDGDELVQSSLADGWDGAPTLVLGNERWSNYDLTLELKKTGGTSVGVLFHWLALGHFRLFNLAAYNNTGKELCYLEEGKWGREAPNYKPDSGLTLDRWYALKVEVRSGTYRCYLNGDLQFSQTDERFTHGHVGLRMRGSTARFRRIKITAPDGHVLGEGLPTLPGVGK